MSEQEVAQIGRGDLAAATATLAAAFADYTLLRNIALPEPRRARACAAFCRMLVTYGVRRGRVYSTADRSAVASWLPPGREWLGVFGLLRSGALTVAWRLGWRGVVALNRAGHVFVAARRRTVPGPHWYLSILGVRPEMKGKGLSRAVLGPGFELADRDRLPCYLETQDAANVPIYRRLGFELADESPVPGGLTNYAMLRPPRA